MKEIEIDKIIVDSDVQMRAATDGFAVDSYAVAMKAGEVFPEIVVFEEEDRFHLADGFHRVEAARKAGVQQLEAEVRKALTIDDVEETGKRAAMLFAAGANDNHGLRRSHADKRRAVTALLRDSDWGSRSDRWVAQAANVSNTFVGKMRSTVNVDSCQKRQGRDGKTRSLPTVDLDTKTRNIISETPIVDEPRELRNLGRIRDVDERHKVARLVRDGKHPTVQLARRKVRHERVLKTARSIEGKYFAILADPPWHFDNDGMRGAAEDEYSTMSLDELLCMDMASYAQDNAVLFLWTTNSHLSEAQQLMAKWGFEYKTNFCWVKDKITRFRFYHKAKHELLLLGIRGSGLMPDGDKLVESVIVAASGRHSQKPEDVYKIIENYYPDVPKLELFARNTRPGWNSYGTELPETEGRS